MGEREIIYLSLHCHHQNDFCIKMGSEGVKHDIPPGAGQKYVVFSVSPMCEEHFCVLSFVI